MPEHVFTLAARGYSVDSQRNDVTLFSLIEEVGSTSLPALMSELVIITLWRRTEEEIGARMTQRTRVVAPDRSVLAQFDTSFVCDRPRQRIQTVIVGFPFRKAGTHRVEVYIRHEGETEWGQCRASYPIEVAQLQTPPFQMLPLQTTA